MSKSRDERLAELGARRLTAIVDWDGTCVPNAWPDRPNEWLPGAREALRELLDAGWDVKIHSTRLHELDVSLDPNPTRDEDLAYVRSMLDEADLQEVGICAESKPPAAVYVDDKNLRFSGDWDETLGAILRSNIERHPNSARFHELLRQAGELHDLKQADYGRGNDPFANVRATEEWGLPAWLGAMVRANDKIRRLQTFAQKGELANESVIDAFMDLAVYALIARVLYEEEAGA